MKPVRRCGIPLMVRKARNNASGSEHDLQLTALRGMPKNITTYAATKAGLASLAEGLRVELVRARSPIRVSTLYPGYIRTEINEKVRNAPFIVDAATGCKAMVRAIESGKAECFVPSWPWRPIGFLMRRLPVAVLARMF
ncbi:SDR family NAD(P)-dependent oxidoreductase [Marinobacter panjinensis]|uniref:SDR family NAD(P)-dependent oxidoreductase n=2 Tax=Marinobacter panjinensis TaxID=2576384 RepID=A0A4U6R5S6_9GAMM|nr:SDR family NAD(P)-dependent oxidoreductase [Marinobacter panjinensis]